MKAHGTAGGDEASAVLGVSVSSRALFDLDADARIFESEGLEAYAAHQEARLDVPLAPGPAHPLVRRLLRMNRPGDRVVRVSVVSGQHPFTGRRVMASLRAHGLDVTQAAFTGGLPAVPFVRPMGGDLFLTRSPSDAQAAIDGGVAAAVLGPLPDDWQDDADAPVRVALDGDAVLFTDECEAIARREGLAAFMRNEERMLAVPLEDGPFARFFRLLHQLRERRPSEVRLSLVTARNGVAADRALATLAHWGCPPDDAFMLGGMPKGPVVAALRPHIFLDDAVRHIHSCAPHAPAGLVPYRTGGRMSELAEAATP